MLTPELLVPSLAVLKEWKAGVAPQRHFVEGRMADGLVFGRQFTDADDRSWPGAAVPS